MKRILKYEFKSHLVILLILAALTILNAITCGISTDFYNGVNNSWLQPYTIFDSFSVVPLYVCVGLTIYVNFYKFTGPCADTLYQIPGKHNFYKKSRTIIGLSGIIIFTLVSYLITIFMHYGFYKAADEFYYLETYQGTTELAGVKADYHFEFYFLYLAGLILLEIATFGFANFIVNEANTMLEAVLGLVALFILFINLPNNIGKYYSLYISYEELENSKTYLLLNSSDGISFNSSLTALTRICSSLLLGKTVNFDSYMDNIIIGRTWLVSSVVFGLVFVIFGIFGLFYSLHKKDYSGEFAGKPGLNSRIMKILPHLAALPIFIGMAAVYSISNILFGYTLTIVMYALGFGIYFGFLALMYKSVKLDKWGWIGMASVMGISIILLVFGTLKAKQLTEEELLVYSLLNNLL